MILTTLYRAGAKNTDKKNVCESLLGALLNTDEKTRDHGHTQADLKKIEIRQEL
jgi:hypothetical protein